MDELVQINKIERHKREKQKWLFVNGPRKSQKKAKG